MGTLLLYFTGALISLSIRDLLINLILKAWTLRHPREEKLDWLEVS